MKAEITFEQLYWNHSLMNFFFRTQAQDTLNELIERAKCSDREAFEKINDYVEANYDDLDELEELFYEDSVRTIAYLMDIELQDVEDDEDEDDED